VLKTLGLEQYERSLENGFDQMDEIQYSDNDLNLVYESVQMRPGHKHMYAVLFYIYMKLEFILYVQQEYVYIIYEVTALLYWC
jgi:hypothetical protein